LFLSVVGQLSPRPAYSFPSDTSSSSSTDLSILILARITTGAIWNTTNHAYIPAYTLLTVSFNVTATSLIAYWLIRAQRTFSITLPGRRMSVYKTAARVLSGHHSSSSSLDIDDLQSDLTTAVVSGISEALYHNFALSGYVRIAGPLGSIGLDILNLLIIFLFTGFLHNWSYSY
jgi:hypothetical protein